MASMVDCGYFASGDKLERKEKVGGYEGRAAKKSETEEVIGGG